MNGATEVLVWPGGENSFRLRIGELRALEKYCNAGVFEILMRLVGQTAKIDDVIQPLRLGLVGGGLSEKEAQEAIDLALTMTSPYGLTVVAADVLRRFIMWDPAEDTPPGEDQAEAEKDPASLRSATVAPDGAPTTVPAPSSATRRKKLTK